MSSPDPPTTHKLITEMMILACKLYVADYEERDVDAVQLSAELIEKAKQYESLVKGR